MADRQISILGATGYTGRLIVEELTRRGVAVLAAARNEEKLRRLATAVGAIDTMVADVADPASLERLASRSRVLINTVGPFVDYGEPVVRAAIANHAHYLDTTGEQPFIKAMLAHDEWSRQQRVAVVPAQAFEIAVADCAAAVAADGFRDVASIYITYLLPLHASQGTQRTALRMLQHTGYAYLGGEWVAERPARVTRVVAFSAPIGDVTAVSFPSAEVITIPRHVPVREVRAFMAVPRAAARVFAAAAPVIGALLRTPLARIAAQLIGNGTDGPDAATRAHDTFHIAIDVRGVYQGVATHRRMFVHGCDPYGLTAVIAAHGAQLMCRDGYDRCGVLAPAAAFDARALLDHLKLSGVVSELIADS